LLFKLAVLPVRVLPLELEREIPKRLFEETMFVKLELSVSIAIRPLFCFVAEPSIVTLFIVEPSALHRINSDRVSS